MNHAANDPFRLQLWLPSANQIALTRSLRAPRQLVFEAFTKPEHLANWWGPHQYRTRVVEMDVRVGGRWNMVNEGAEGEAYSFSGEFLEVDPPHRLTWTFGFEGHSHREEITFKECDGVTETSILCTFDSTEDRDDMLKGGMEWGSGQSYDRLETLLLFSTEASSQPFFTIQRTFDAPRKHVWHAWSDAEALAKWWGPKGMRIEVAHLQFEPGGVFHYSMASPNGTMWGRFMYREISPFTRLVFVNSFSNREGGITHAPFSDHWPLEVLNLVRFEEIAGRTVVTLAGAPITSAPDELDEFGAHFASMEQGFGGTFDQLSEYLSEEQS